MHSNNDSNNSAAKNSFACVKCHTTEYVKLSKSTSYQLLTILKDVESVGRRLHYFWSSLTWTCSTRSHSQENDHFARDELWETLRHKGHFYGPAEISSCSQYCEFLWQTFIIGAYPVSDDGDVICVARLFSNEFQHVWITRKWRVWKAQLPIREEMHSGWIVELSS